jgi:hypothetical protein
MATRAKTSTKSKTTKTTRKSAPKTVENIDLPQSNTFSQNFASRINFKNKKLLLLVLAGLFVIATGLLLARNALLAATVNGKTITRIEVIRALERANGKATLDALITKSLIEQEAEKQGVLPSQDEVNKEIDTISKNIEAQGTSLDEALKAQNMTRGQLEDEIKVQLALRKMTAKDVKVTDKEVNDLVAENTQALPEGTSEEQFRQQARAQLEQQKQQDASEKLIANLRTNAKIRTYINY